MSVTAAERFYYKTSIQDSYYVLWRDVINIANITRR
jgi:hypothetical protein